MRLFLMKTNYYRQIVFGLSLLCFLALMIQACGPSTQSDSSNATVTAMSRAIAGTATAEKANVSNTGDLATAQAEATQQGREISITQTAQLANRDVSKLATATIAAPIIAELPSYGLNASSGKVGWIHNPITLEAQGTQQFAYGNDYMNVMAKNFVLAADITWNTKYGESGCGFMFRSDGDKQKPNQYMVIATRFANGRVIFTALADGELANIHDFYPKYEDRSFQAQNDTTNRIAIVARDNLIEIYTNYVKIGEVDTTKPPQPMTMPATPLPPIDTSNAAEQSFYKEQLEAYKQMAKEAQQNFQIANTNYIKSNPVFTDGFLSMLALTQGGKTVCKFDNAWLWLLEP
jgi:hypothetical protein